MVEKQLNKSLDDIIKQKSINKAYTIKKIITTKNHSDGFHIQRKIIKKPDTFVRKSPHNNYNRRLEPPKKQYYTSATTKQPQQQQQQQGLKKNPKQIFTQKYKEQLALQQMQEQEELAENQARQQRIEQLAQIQQNYKRIKIENLPHLIDHQELRGELAKLGIVWDELGYSTGTAVVEYKTEEDAKKAIEEYDYGLILKVSYDDSQ